MSRVFRWQWILPRLLAACVFLLAARYALDTTARRAAERWSAMLLGSPVEVESAHVSVPNRQVTLGNLRLPAAAGYSLAADYCELDLSAGALLHKRAIVEAGRVTGLRLTSSALNDASTVEAAQPTTSAESARDWLVAVGQRFAEDYLRDFESVERTKALRSNFTQQCAELLAQAAELERRTAALQEETESAETNRLRHREFFLAVPEETKELQEHHAALAAEIARLPAVLETERRAIVAARRRDEELIRERLIFEPIGAAAFTPYLLQDEAARPLEELLGWLRWMRLAVPAEPRNSGTPRRGQDLLFGDCRPAPNLLVRALALEATTRVAGRELRLRGSLTDVSDQPSLHGAPVRLRLSSVGGPPMELQAILDRTGSAARDELIVDCRSFALPEARLGRPDQLELQSAACTGSLSISVVVDGERLSGDVQLVQNGVRLSPALHGILGKPPLAAPLDASLRSVNSVAARVSLSGTLSEPCCTLWSTLGPAMAEALERALVRAAEDHTQAVLAQARQQVDEQLAELERQLADAQASLTRRMNGIGVDIARIAEREAPPERVSAEQLGRLPAHSLFR